MGSYQTTTVDITVQSRARTENMEFNYLILLLASSIATATADARIVFQQDFVPRNNVDVEPEIITPTSTTFTPTSTTMTTTTMEAEAEEVTSSSKSPLCAGSEDWCDSPPDYPDQAILAAAVRQNNTLGSLFERKLRLRNDFPEFEEFVEDSKNKDGEYKFIVNHPEGGEEYVQQVRVNICRAAEQSCGHGRLADSGLDTKCRQDYSDHKLVSLSNTGEELQVETFRFPSCCSCFVSQFSEYL